MELVNRIKGRATTLPQEASITARNIGDISIAIEEGISDTRRITISAWNPAIASALFWEIRGGLRDPDKSDAYEAVALLKAKQYLTEAFKEKRNEEVS